MGLLPNLPIYSMEFQVESLAIANWSRLLPLSELDAQYVSSDERCDRICGYRTEDRVRAWFLRVATEI